MEEPERFQYKASKAGKMLTISALRTVRPVIDMVSNLAIVIIFPFFLVYTKFGQSFISSLSAQLFFAVVYLGMAINIYSGWKRYQWARHGREELRRKDGILYYEKIEGAQLLESRQFVIADIDRAFWQYKKLSSLLSGRSKDRIRRAPITLVYKGEMVQIIDDLREGDGSKLVGFIEQGAWRAKT